MEYTDCVLHIKDEENIGIEYMVDGSKTNVRGKLNIDPVIKLTIRRLNYWVNFGIEQQGKNLPSQESDLRAIGLNLYRMLFSDESIRKSFLEAYAQFYRRKIEKGSRMRLRLVFERAAEDLGEFPWEFLYIPGEKDDRGRERINDGFFASAKTELVLTRCVPPSRADFDGLSQNELKAEPLRILVAVCNPDAANLPPIDTEEVEKVLSQIQGLRHANVMRIDNPTYGELFDALNTDPPWHIFHFISHGRPGEVALIMDKEDPNYDEDKPRQPSWHKSKAFNSLFAGHSPNLIFLHACKGAMRDTREAFNSVARELVYSEVPAVVAMQYNISGFDASRFAKMFYEELGKGSDIEEAVNQGRQVLGRLSPPWEHPRFGTPVVIMQRLKNQRAMVLPVQDDDENKEKQPAQGIPIALGRGSLAGAGVAPSSEVSKPSKSSPASALDSVKLQQ
jgi:hypothetical protein